MGVEREMAMGRNVRPRQFNFRGFKGREKMVQSLRQKTNNRGTHLCMVDANSL